MCVTPGVTVVPCVTVVTCVTVASSTLHTSLLSHMRDSSSTVVHVLSYVTVVPWTSVTVAYYDSSYVVTTATCVTVVTCVGLSKFRYAK